MSSGRAGTRRRLLVSVVVPVFNEEANLDELRKRLEAVFRTSPERDFELILVDDHSSDRSRELCLRWAEQDSRVRYLRFSRNFGSHAACTAGLEECRGDAAALMAADLQDPPEDLPRLVQAWEQGAQVVWAVRTEREGEPLRRTLPARIYYSLMRRLAHLDLPPEGADFVLVDRCVVEAIARFPERSTSLFALLCWVGFRQTTIPYVKKKRHGGTSGWTLRKKIRLLMDSIVGFTFWPVRMLSLLGTVAIAGGVVYSLILVYLRLREEIVVPGWTGLMVVSLMGFGTLMVMVGVLGEYLWRTLEQVRGRPRFLVEERVEGPESKSV